MNIQDIIVKNSFTISGSLEIPVVATISSISTDLPTGSLFFDLSSNLLYLASGSQLHIVGEQENSIPPTYSIEYMVVGGGGGGGMDMGGGGGAGGFTSSSFDTSVGVTYIIEV